MKTSTKVMVVSLCCLPALATTTLAATNTIQIFNNDFGSAPSTHIDPTINLGDTVRWVWVSGFHSTTAAPGQSEVWDSVPQFAPFTFNHTFNNLGTFGYYCSVHGGNAGCGNGSGMFGRIFVVQPGASAFNIAAIASEGNDVRVSWTTTGLCKTNALQRATGTADGSYTNDYTDIFVVTNTVGAATNYLDVGATTNFPAHYYRVRLVP